MLVMTRMVSFSHQSVKSEGVGVTLQKFFTKKKRCD
jgi:hypothetical protein